MISRYRYPLLAILSLTLLGAAPLAQARDRHHVDFSLVVPPLVVSSHHGYRPHAAAHYHGRQICHLRHEYRHHEYGRDQYYGDRHRYYRDHDRH